MSIYVKPVVEVVGTLHELTLSPIIPGKVKIIGGDLDGVKVKIGNQVFPVGYS